MKSTSIYNQKEKKTLHKMTIQGTCLNVIKAMYDKITASIILNSEN